MTIKIPFFDRFLNTNKTTTTIASLEARLEGTRLTRIITELVGNSALFPILDGIRSISTDGFSLYLQEISHYILLIACLIQALYLGYHSKRSWSAKLFGNLIGVILYTILEISLEGLNFFQEPYHWVFWGYGLSMALLTTWQHIAQQHPTLPTVLLSVAKVGLLPAIYFISEVGSNLTTVNITKPLLIAFMQTPTHQFIVFGSLFFGLLMGLANAQLVDYTGFLKQAAHKLKEYSEWSLDSTLIDNAFNNETAFNLRRVKRTILFMDIRGFTAWAEQTDPAKTVNTLNQYYNLSEKIIAQFEGHKPSFAADEVMTRFDNADQAVAAARALQSTISNFLTKHQLSVGIGIHTGIAMEGLLGSDTTKQFDIIGDSVNTAKRLESAAESQEILISATTKEALSTKIESKETRYLNLKGKAKPVAAFLIKI